MAAILERERGYERVLEVFDGVKTLHDRRSPDRCFPTPSTAAKCFASGSDLVHTVSVAGRLDPVLSKS
jgi:hypothetical protein